MRALKSIWSMLRSAGESPRRHGPRPGARVVELLRRDSAGALPGPPPGFSRRVSAALRAVPRPPAASSVPTVRTSRPRLARLQLALGATGLAAAVLLADFDPLRRPEPAGRDSLAALQVHRATLSPPPAAPAPHHGLGLERFRPRPRASAAVSLDARLLAEARLLASDGERVARALVEALPRPPRHVAER